MAFFVMDAKYCDIVARNVRPKIGEFFAVMVLTLHLCIVRQPPMCCNRECHKELCPGKKKK
jgi:hypothetical protein